MTEAQLLTLLGPQPRLRDIEEHVGEFLVRLGYLDAANMLRWTLNSIIDHEYGDDHC